MCHFVHIKPQHCFKQINMQNSRANRATRTHCLFIRRISVRFQPNDFRFYFNHSPLRRINLFDDVIKERFEIVDLIINRTARTPHPVPAVLL